MCSCRWAGPLTALLLCCPLPVCAAEEGKLADALALERAVQQAIKKAEPSIACILVSRSDLYRPFEEKKPDAVPGQLGKFDALQAGRAIRSEGEERARLIKSLDLSDPDNTPESYGSGVVLDRSGLILTNAHVVLGASKVYVRLPGGAGSYADIHALDGRIDLAVLRLIDPVPNLRELPLGKGEGLSKGQFVIGLANPFAAGFRDGSPSASWGIVSNLRQHSSGQASEVDRNRLTLHQFGALIQTDVRLSIGCSGGALLNLAGELIGLTTARAALTGVESPGGYAVPITAGMRRIIEVLRRGEEVEYGFLGVQFDRGCRKGVLLSRVVPHSAARKAGLKRGDYILSVGGMKVHTFDDVFLALGMHLAGSTVEVERGRSPDGPGEKVSLTLGKYYVPLPSIASKRPPARGGLRVDHASLLVQRGGGGLQVIFDGVLIREVVTGSSADQARLRLDQIITHVNGRKVLTPAEYYRAMSDARGTAELTLLRPGNRFERVRLKLD